MKNFTKYSLLLIFATCVWNSDVFGMIQFLKNAYHSVVPQDDPVSMAQKTKAALMDRDFNKATNILKAAGEKLNGEQFLQYLNHYTESYHPAPILMQAIHMIIYSVDKNIVESSLEFSNTLIKSALELLKGNQFVAFFNACNSNGESPLLYLVMRPHFGNLNSIFTIEKNLIAAAVTALKAGHLTVDQFFGIITGQKKSESFPVLAYAVNYNDYELVKFLINTARHWLNDEQFNQFLCSQCFFPNDPTSYTTLTMTVTTDWVYKTGDKLCRLVLDAAMTLPDGDFERFLNAQNGIGETALDIAYKAGNEKIITLLENAKEKRAEKMKIMDAKTQIKNIQAEVRLLPHKIERYKAVVNEKRKMLADSITAINNTIE